MSTEIMPCPFCKDTRVHAYYDEIRMIGYVKCMGHFPKHMDSCGWMASSSTGSPQQSKYNAIERWNKFAALASRPADDAQAAMPESGEAVACTKCGDSKQEFNYNGDGPFPCRHCASPPAKPAADFDSERSTPRREAAVKIVLADGWKWDGAAWVREPAADDTRAVDGWVMVPRELTDAMFTAHLMHLSVAKAGPKAEKLHDLATAAWHAMLDAAPNAPASSSLNEPSGNSGQLDAAPALVVTDEMVERGCVQMHDRIWGATSPTTKVVLQSEMREALTAALSTTQQESPARTNEQAGGGCGR